MRDTRLPSYGAHSPNLFQRAGYRANQTGCVGYRATPARPHPGTGRARDGPRARKEGSALEGARESDGGRVLDQRAFWDVGRRGCVPAQAGSLGGKEVSCRVCVRKGGRDAAAPGHAMGRYNCGLCCLVRIVVWGSLFPGLGLDAARLRRCLSAALVALVLV